MNTKEYDTGIGDSFHIVEYNLADDCKARVVTDKLNSIAIYPNYELMDNKRWYSVPKEVFDLFLKAYEIGKQDALRNSTASR